MVLKKLLISSSFFSIPRKILERLFNTSLSDKFINGGNILIRKSFTLHNIAEIDDLNKESEPEFSLYHIVIF